MALLLNVIVKSLFRCRQFLLNLKIFGPCCKKNLSDYTKYAQLQRIASILKLSLLVESIFNSTFQKALIRSSDCADAEAGLCLCCSHASKSGFLKTSFCDPLMSDVTVRPSSVSQHRPKSTTESYIIIPFIPHKEIQVKGSQITVKWWSLIINAASLHF